MVVDIKIAHIGLNTFTELVDAGLGIMARDAVAKHGSVAAAAKALRCAREKLEQLRKNTGQDMQVLNGAVLWPLEPIGAKGWWDVKEEIENALVLATVSLRPRRALDRFYDIDERRLRRIEKRLGIGPDSSSQSYQLGSSSSP